MPSSAPRSAEDGFDGDINAPRPLGDELESVEASSVDAADSWIGYESCHPLTWLPHSKVLKA